MGIDTRNQTGKFQREIARHFHMSRNIVKKYIEIKGPISYREKLALFIDSTQALSKGRLID